MDSYYLSHYGVPGMKCGVRKYQNSDGSFTKEGLKRYGYSQDGTMSKKGIKNASKDIKRSFKNNRVGLLSQEQSKSFGKNTEEVLNKYKKEANNNPYEKALTKMDKELPILIKKYRQNPTEKLKTQITNMNEEYRNLVYKNTQVGYKIAQKYIKQFNEATIKDLGFSNSKAISDYMYNNNKTLWDTTYINNYAWYNKLV